MDANSSSPLGAELEISGAIPAPGRQARGLSATTGALSFGPTLEGAQNNNKAQIMLSTFKPNGQVVKVSPASRKKSSSLKANRQIGVANSLESIDSRCSVSSGGGCEDKQRQLSHNNKPATELASSASESEASSRPSERAQLQFNRALMAQNRYVSPPKLAPDKDWPPASQPDRPSSVANNSDERLVAMMSAGGPGERDPTTNPNGANNNNNNKSPDAPGKKPAQVAVQLVPASQQQQASAGDNKPPFMFAGILASLLGSVFFSISILFIKLLPDSDGYEEKAKALFFRGLLMTICCSVTIISRGSTFLVPPEEIWVNAARAVFGTVGVFGSYCALKYISIGDATAIMFSSPIWTSILSHFILKEPIQWVQLIALPISLFGIILIAHPALIVGVDLLYLSGSNGANRGQQMPANLSTRNPSSTTTMATNYVSKDYLLSNGSNPLQEHPIIPDISGGPDFEHRWPGILIAILVSFVISGTYIVLKYRKRTPIQTTTFWLSVVIMVSTIIFMSIFGFGGFPSSLTEWSLLIGNGIFSWLGQSTLQWAFLHESATILSIMRTMDVALTFTLSALFLDEEIYWTSIVGSTIISLVVISIVFNNWIQNLTCMNIIKRSEDGQISSTTKSAKSIQNEDPSEKLLIEGSAKAGTPYIISTSKI